MLEKLNNIENRVLGGGGSCGGCDREQVCSISQLLSKLEWEVFGDNPDVPDLPDVPHRSSENERVDRLADGLADYFRLLRTSRESNRQAAASHCHAHDTRHQHQQRHQQQRWYPKAYTSLFTANSEYHPKTTTDANCGEYTNCAKCQVPFQHAASYVVNRDGGLSRRAAPPHSTTCRGCAIAWHVPGGGQQAAAEH
jgi:hypothetical protein